MAASCAKRIESDRLLVALVLILSFSLFLTHPLPLGLPFICVANCQASGCVERLLPLLRCLSIEMVWNHVIDIHCTWLGVGIWECNAVLFHSFCCVCDANKTKVFAMAPLATRQFYTKRRRRRRRGKWWRTCE